MGGQGWQIKSQLVSIVNRRQCRRVAYCKWVTAVCSRILPMKVFLSYASEDKEISEQIQLAMVGAGVDMFFEAERLPVGGDYHDRIRKAV